MTTQRANNIGLLRLGLATSVIVSHAFPLAEGHELNEPLVRFTHGQTTIGQMAVGGFFALSGYLILQSWQSDPHLGRFLLKRALRLYPGFVAMSLFCVLVAGALGSPTAYTYLQHVYWDWQTPVLDTLTMAMPSTHGAFADVPFPNAINGSMWTIRPEALCYLFIAGLGVCALASRSALLAAFGLAYVGYVLHPVPSQWHLAAHFMAGAAAYHYRSAIVARGWLIAVSGLALVVTSRLGGLAVVLPVAWVYLVMVLSLHAPAITGPLTDHGRDFSYGVYLYAFPVQQLLMYWFPHLQPFDLAMLAMVGTAPFAVASWYGVERPALALKPASPRRPRAVPAVA